ncbi:MAG: hypothetical protein LBF55_01970 [Prevotellaceae bacterium]|jgi:hypothetical protein|nr:hypothetical protein [Prevotellaceae bacterium]
MKQILIIMPCIFLAVACTRTEKWSVTLRKAVINATDKSLYYEVKTDEGNKSRFIKALDSIDDMVFCREHSVDRSMLEVAFTSTVKQDDIKIEQETIFNLTDTSKYEYKLKYEIIPQQGNTEEEMIFARHLVWELGEHSTDKNSVIIIKLNVTDSILHIMQKDYAMLEKFSEHYEQK